jgi:hypothetical protein
MTARHATTYLRKPLREYLEGMAPLWEHCPQMTDEQLREDFEKWLANYNPTRPEWGRSPPAQ